MTDLASAVIAKQREFEQKFAATVFIDQGYVLQSCGWLEPEIISDIFIRQFWQDIRAGKSNIEAAESAGLLTDLMQWITDSPFVNYSKEYALQISKYSYFVSLSTLTGQLANTISKFDLEQSYSIIQKMMETYPFDNRHAPDIVEIAKEFEHLVLSDDRSIKTGIAGLDSKTGGLERQTLSVLAGRPSMGKTAMALQIARNAAGPEKLKVELFSLEMNRKSLWARIACPSANLTWMEVRSKRISSDQEQALLIASRRIANEYKGYLNIHDGRHTTDTIWQACASNRPDLVVIDHLRRIQDEGDNENKRLGSITEKLAEISKELDCHVLLCVQLNREVEHRKTNKVPVLADIRDSGEVEENADQVFMLYREDYYSNGSNAHSKKSCTDLWIRKFRDGVRDAQIQLVFDMNKQWFEPKY